LRGRLLRVRLALLLRGGARCRAHTDAS
jgi:hypothetical protein